MTAVVRLGAIIVAMELGALLVAYGYFGLPVLAIGVPALLLTVMTLLFVRASERPRRRLEKHRAARWDPNATVPGGLMSGFFDPAKFRGAPPR